MDNEFYNECFRIPLIETNGGGWKELTKKLSITTDGEVVDNITCWRYRDDLMFFKDDERYKLPQFTSYQFV